MCWCRHGEGFKHPLTAHILKACLPAYSAGRWLTRWDLVKSNQIPWREFLYPVPLLHPHPHSVCHEPLTLTMILQLLTDLKRHWGQATMDWSSRLWTKSPLLPLKLLCWAFCQKANTITHGDFLCWHKSQIASSALESQKVPCINLLFPLMLSMVA